MISDRSFSPVRRPVYRANLFVYISQGEHLFPSRKDSQKKSGIKEKPVFFPAFMRKLFKKTIGGHVK